MGLRESPKNLLIVTFGLIRAQLEMVGRALHERGAWTEPTTSSSWTSRRAASADRRAVRELVAERRAAYAVELRRRHIPRLLLGDGTEPEATLTTCPAGRRADREPGLAGTITARARVVLDRLAHTWSQARSWSPPRPIRAGPRCS